MLAVLETDKQFRYVGVTGDLFDQETVKFEKDPHLDCYFVIENCESNKFINSASNHTFRIKPKDLKATIQAHMWPCLKKLNYNNMIIAGGILSQWLTGNRYHYNLKAPDVDI